MYTKASEQHRVERKEWRDESNKKDDERFKDSARRHSEVLEVLRDNTKQTAGLTSMVEQVKTLLENK
jgi:hypothetical protein